MQRNAFSSAQMNLGERLGERCARGYGDLVASFVVVSTCKPEDGRFGWIGNASKINILCAAAASTCLVTRNEYSLKSTGCQSTCLVRVLSLPSLYYGCDEADRIISSPMSSRAPCMKSVRAASTHAHPRYSSRQISELVDRY